jgi:hypothetical protein
MCKTWGRIHIWINIILMPIRNQDPEVDLYQNAKLIRIWNGIVLIKTMPIHNTEYIYNTVPVHMIILYLYYKKIKEKNKTLVSFWKCFDLTSIKLLR